jgi:hypothetical protein
MHYSSTPYEYNPSSVVRVRNINCTVTKFARRKRALRKSSFSVDVSSRLRCYAIPTLQPRIVLCIRCRVRLYLDANHNGQHPKTGLSRSIPLLCARYILSPHNTLLRVSTARVRAAIKTRPRENHSCSNRFQSNHIEINNR